MDPPGPIPNPAVKHLIADGTTEGIRGRVGRRRNFLRKRSHEGGFVFVLFVVYLICALCIVYMRSEHLIA